MPWVQKKHIIKFVKLSSSNMWNMWCCRKTKSKYLAPIQLHFWCAAAQQTPVSLAYRIIPDPLKGRRCDISCWPPLLFSSKCCYFVMISRMFSILPFDLRWSALLFVMGPPFRPCLQCYFVTRAWLDCWYCLPEALLASFTILHWFAGLLGLVTLDVALHWSLLFGDARLGLCPG